MSLCESNCEFTGYNFDKKEAICECKIKIKTTNFRNRCK